MASVSAFHRKNMGGPDFRTIASSVIFVSLFLLQHEVSCSCLWMVAVQRRVALDGGNRFQIGLLLVTVRKRNPNLYDGSLSGESLNRELTPQKQGAFPHAQNP